MQLTMFCMDLEKWLPRLNIAVIAQVSKLLPVYFNAG